MDLLMINFNFKKQNISTEMYGKFPVCVSIGRFLIEIFSRSEMKNTQWTQWISEIKNHA